MSRQKEFPKLAFNQALPWIVLAILLVYTYAKFVEHPYLGFRMGPPGNVILIFSEGSDTALQIGDQIIEIDSVRWEDFRSDLRRNIFDNVQTGQTLPLLIDRNGEQISIPWMVSGFNIPEFIDLLISEGWLGFFLWMVGTFTLLSLRPKDTRWQLIIAFNYLTAIWLVLGSGVSFYHIWQSAVFLRMAIWLSLPVYLHLHWLFPVPLGNLPKIVVRIGYLSAGLLAIAEWFQLLPLNLYTIGFLLTMGGSFILLLLHPFLLPESRRDLGFFFIISLISLMPSVVIGIVLGFLPEVSGLLATWFGTGGALLSLPLLPLAYLYVAFRRQLGDFELRLNRLLSIYFFVILVGIIVLSLIVLLDRLLTISGEVLVISLISAVLTAAAFIWLYAGFEKLVESRVLGIPLPSKGLLQIYSNRITTSNSLSDLVRVIDEEIIPSLLVRQFVFLQVENGSSGVLSKTGVNKEQIPKAQDVPDLMNQTGVYLTPDPLSKDQFYSWIRLILPLKLGEETIGFWLFGRRDPDDMYSQLEIPIIKSLANQTAVALSNILQTERIKDLYEANIERFEQEKLRLSRDLHDSILNQIATLLMSSDAPVFSPSFQKGFDVLTERLREIVSDLRSPMLDMGLKLAFEDIADKLADRNQDTVKVLADIQADGECRYPEKVESHLYRIMQEVCENTLKHAHAETMKITLRLYPKRIELQVEDDGIGFDAGTSRKLDDMLIGKHFGLAGIHERASLIGAQVHVDSKPGQGTRVQVIWEFKESI